ncbi:MAG: hypothetical protein AAGF12_35235 [Myxococcota bacterium]
MRRTGQAIVIFVGGVFWASLSGIDVGETGVGGIDSLAIPAFVPGVGTAAAQESSPRERSRQQFERGVQHLSESRYAEAVEALEAARVLYPTAPIHFNLGLAYRGADRVTDAIAAFERFLQASGDGIQPGRLQEVRRSLRSLRAALAEVRLDISPADATVTIDGDPVLRGSAVELDPGRHVVVAQAPGHREAREELNLEPGSRRVVQLALTPAREQATLVLDIEPDEALVRVDGRLRGSGDRELTVDPGAHILQIEVDGETESTDFEVGPGERLELSLALSSGGSLTWLFVSLGVLAVAGGITAAILLLGQDDEEPLPGDLGVATTALGVNF